jgi:hypothetical protein
LTNKMSLVAIFQDEYNTILRSSTHILDQVALDGRGSRSRSFFAVGNGNTATRSSLVLCLLDDGITQRILKLLELFSLDKFLG